MAKSTYVWLDQLSRTLRPRDPDARRDPRRGARHARPLGRHRPVADRPVGALDGVGADQADARQRRRGRLGLLARRLPDRRRPRRRGAPTRTCATGPGRAASGSRATWSPTTWASTRAGSSSTRSGSCRSPSRPTPPTRSAGRTCRPTIGSGSSSRTTTGTTATPRSSSSGSTGRPATSATSTTATTARASRGTTRRSSTSSIRPSASRSSGRSSTSPAASRSSASTPRWSSPRSTSSACGGRSPGTGGGIPSRAEHAIAKARVRRGGCRSSSGARSSTGSPPRSRTRSCWPRRSGCSRATSCGPSGMHRVYNSAFMHMLRDEDGAGYRKVIKETIEFDPEILKRYVNFMSNPDEKTAIEQFGKGDKYFGVATVLATLPGLPMLGHGQVQGFGEKYGMEFRRATLDERPDPWLVERHEREIFPLLHRRAWFAEADDFLLYDLVTDGGARRRGRPRLLERARAGALARRSTTSASRRRSGRIRESAAYAAQDARRVEAASSGGRWRRASGCRTTRRPSSRSATRGPGWSSCARAARSGSTACEVVARRLRDRTSSGSSARSATASPASGRGSPRGSAGPASPRSRTRCARCSSNRSTRRCGAIFADGLVAALIDGTASRAQLDELRAAVRQRSSRPSRRRRASTETRRRSRPTSGVGPSACSRRRRGARGTWPRHRMRRPSRPWAATPCRPDSIARTARPCSPGWRWVGSGRSPRAPTSPPRAVAWYDELRLPGRARGRPPRRRVRRGRGVGRSPTRSGSC